jgi:DNA polymerase alpha subunit B
MIETSPDVLLLASNLKPFVKVVNGVVCVNVGKLTRGQGGGSYARVIVHPYSEVEEFILTIFFR